MASVELFPCLLPGGLVQMSAKVGCCGDVICFTASFKMSKKPEIGESEVAEARISEEERLRGAEEGRGEEEMGMATKEVEG